MTAKKKLPRRIGVSFLIFSSFKDSKPVHQTRCLECALLVRHRSPDFLYSLSGDIVQDAHMVWFIYRDEVYNTVTKDKSEAEIIIAKKRGGETRTAKLAWKGEFSKFTFGRFFIVLKYFASESLS